MAEGVTVEAAGEEGVAAEEEEEEEGVVEESRIPVAKLVGSACSASSCGEGESPPAD